MTAEAPRTPAEVARATFDAVIAKDLHGIVAGGAPDYVDDFVPVGAFQGHEAIQGFFRETFAAFPDFEMAVERIVADGSSAVVQWHLRGTFSGGPFLGIQPTGRRIDVRGVDVMEIADGLIRRNTIYYDGASFARQVGLLPAQGSRGDRTLISVFNVGSRLRRAVAQRASRAAR
jgi:steroid delta-isomerase-like uncharacterized protein